MALSSMSQKLKDLSTILSLDYWCLCFLVCLHLLFALGDIWFQLSGFLIDGSCGLFRSTIGDSDEGSTVGTAWGWIGDTIVVGGVSYLDRRNVGNAQEIRKKKKEKNGCVPINVRCWDWYCMHPFTLDGEDEEELCWTDDLRDRGGALGDLKSSRDKVFWDQRV